MAPNQSPKLMPLGCLCLTIKPYKFWPCHQYFGFFRVNFLARIKNSVMLESSRGSSFFQIQRFWYSGLECLVNLSSLHSLLLKAGNKKSKEFSKPRIEDASHLSACLLLGPCWAFIALALKPHSCRAVMNLSIPLFSASCSPLFPVCFALSHSFQSSSAGPAWEEPALGPL